MPSEVIAFFLPPAGDEVTFDVVTLDHEKVHRVWTGREPAALYAEVAAAYPSCELLADPSAPAEVESHGFRATALSVELLRWHAALAWTKARERDLRDPEAVRRSEFFLTAAERAVILRDGAFSAMLAGCRIEFEAYQESNQDELLETYASWLTDKTWYLQVGGGEPQTLRWGRGIPWLEELLQQAYGFAGQPLWDERVSLRDWAVISDAFLAIEPGRREVSAVASLREVFTPHDLLPNVGSTLKNASSVDEISPGARIRGTIKGGKDFDDQVQVIDLTPTTTTYFGLNLGERRFATNGHEDLWDEAVDAVEDELSHELPKWVVQRGLAALYAEREGLEVDLAELALNSLRHAQMTVMLANPGNVLGYARCTHEDGRRSDLTLAWVDAPEGCEAALEVRAKGRPPFGLAIRVGDPANDVEGALAHHLGFELLPVFDEPPPREPFFEWIGALYTISQLRGPTRSKRKFRAPSLPELEVLVGWEPLPLGGSFPARDPG